VFENGMLREIFKLKGEDVTGEWRRMRGEVIHYTLYFCLKEFFIPRRNERDLIKNVYRSSCKVPVILAKF
jgi:hypothetical protein